MPSRLRLSNPERETLAEIGRRLGPKALAGVACVAKPGTIPAWYRKLVAQTFDGSKHRSCPGRPRISPEVELLIVRFARENAGWGYDRIVGALGHLGHTVSDQTIGNVLRRHGIAPAPKRSETTTTWKDFIASHLAVLAGVDFFTEGGSHGAVWRIITFLVFIHLETRRVAMAGLTRHPTESWMEPIAHNATDESAGCLRELRHVLHDRGSKFCALFRSILRAGRVEPVRLPARGPDLNAFVQRWVRSVKEECLSKLILFGEGSLKRALAQLLEHYHSERPHQGNGNVILFPVAICLQALGDQSSAGTGLAAYFDTMSCGVSFLTIRRAISKCLRSRN